MNPSYKDSRTGTLGLCICVSLCVALCLPLGQTLLDHLVDEQQVETEEESALGQNDKA